LRRRHAITAISRDNCVNLDPDTCVGRKVFGQGKRAADGGKASAVQVDVPAEDEPFVAACQELHIAAGFASYKGIIERYLFSIKMVACKFAS
jgi:hypothetical protein